jgi:hypothetical protein
MKQKKVKITALLLLGLGLANANAQSGSVASGGDATGAGGSVAYSVGQVAYTTSTGTNGSVAQGVQQPYEILTVGIKDETAMSISLSVFPNPTTDNLTLQVQDFNNEVLVYQLFDIQGKLLESKTVSSNQTQISMSGLQSATYFINVTQENKTVKSFKIIKN